jgi:hypothetical protein
MQTRRTSSPAALAATNRLCVAVSEWQVRGCAESGSGQAVTGVRFGAW